MLSTFYFSFSSLVLSNCFFWTTLLYSTNRWGVLENVLWLSAVEHSIVWPPVVLICWWLFTWSTFKAKNMQGKSLQVWKAGCKLGVGGSGEVTRFFKAWGKQHSFWSTSCLCFYIPSVNSGKWAPELTELWVCAHLDACSESACQLIPLMPWKNYYFLEHPSLLFGSLSLLVEADSSWYL